MPVKIAIEWKYFMYLILVHKGPRWKYFNSENLRIYGIVVSYTCMHVVIYSSSLRGTCKILKFKPQTEHNWSITIINRFCSQGKNRAWGEFKCPKCGGAVATPGLTVARSASWYHGASTSPAPTPQAGLRLGITMHSGIKIVLTIWPCYT